MIRFHSLPLAGAFALLAATFAPVSAQEATQTVPPPPSTSDPTWHACSHPDWGATAAETTEGTTETATDEATTAMEYTDVLVPGTMIATLGTGDGVVCTPLSDSYATARSNACATVQPGDSWAVYVAETSRLIALTCD